MASPAEVQPQKDKINDIPAKNLPGELPNLDRVAVLKDGDTIKPGQPTANLRAFYIVDGKTQDAGTVEKFVAKDDPKSGAVEKFVAKDDPKSEAAAATIAPEQVAARPDAARPAEKFSQESAITTLQSPDATAQQKIEAVSKLYDSMPKDGNGRVHVTIHDGDKDKQFEISKQKLGHGVNLTHLTYRDEKGHVHPVLRGVERKGHVDQEHDKNGAKADFKGDWWAKHAENSAISQFSGAKEAPVAPEPPRRPDNNEAPLPPRRPDNNEAPLPPERPHSHLRRHHPADGQTPEPGDGEHKHPGRRKHPGPSSDSEPGQEPTPRREPRPEHRPEPIPERKREREPENNDAPIRPGAGHAQVSDLDKFWTVQPSNFECGSASEAMAISHVTGRGKFSAGEIHQLSRENGSLSAGAFPHGDGNRNMEESLKRHGVNAETHSFGNNPNGEIQKLSEELDKGHSAVAYIRNPATGHGHFIFIEGKTPDGRYVVGDPGSHRFARKPAVSEQELNRWLTGEKRGTPYFVSVW
jgi:hypothetical protein